LALHTSYPWLKKSNGCNSKSILSDDSIKVSQESKFDNKYELVRITGESIDDKHCFGTLALTKQN
jgi:hypothetical protein